jgi:hypothetical protein
MYTSDWPRCLALFEIIATTLTSQMYTLGICGRGATVAVGLVCGNALLVGSTLQSDPLSSLVCGVYGLNVTSFSTLELVSSIVFIQIHPLTAASIGYYLVVWCWVNALFFACEWRRGRRMESLFFGFMAGGTFLEAVQGLSGCNMHHLPNFLILLAILFPILELSVTLGGGNLAPATTSHQEERGDVVGSITQILGCDVTQPI